MYKETEFCTSYIRNHKGSTSPKCLENVAVNRCLKALLMLMKDASELSGKEVEEHQLMMTIIHRDTI